MEDREQEELRRGGPDGGLSCVFAFLSVLMKDEPLNGGGGTRRQEKQSPETLVLVLELETKDDCKDSDLTPFI